MRVDYLTCSPIDCACAKNLCQNFGWAMALPALPVSPDLLKTNLVAEIENVGFAIHGLNQH